MAFNRHYKTRFKQAGFLFYVKLLLSHIWPIKIEEYHKNSSYLELSLYQGKIHLNTKGANYSYGNLHTAFRNLFVEVGLNWAAFDKTLLLGFGLGGVADLILQRNSTSQITAVEINPQIIHWHDKYLIRSNTKIIDDDAFHFVEHTTEQYNLIIVDLYINLDVPTQFETNTFIHKLKTILIKDGTLIFNKVVQNQVQANQFNELMLLFSNHFKNIQVNHQFSLNRFIVAK